MSDRCQTHKARACQKCAGDADASTALRDMEIERNILRITLREMTAEVERLAGVVAKVRELADPLLTVAALLVRGAYDDDMDRMSALMCRSAMKTKATLDALRAATGQADLS